MPAVLSDSGRMDGVSLGLVASPRPNCATDSEDDAANGGIHTFNQTHMRKAFQLMNDLRSKQMLCDVQLVAGSVEVPAHRVVLAACSPYFCAMFTGDMSESKAQQVEIREVDGQTLRKLVDYIYTAEIEVTEDNVQVLLPAASLLQLMDVRQVCCEFLQSQLHPTNCLGIRAFADLHTCTQLLSQAHAYAEQHFSEVVQSEEFLGLSLQQVSSLISSDRLTVSTEEKVCLPARFWSKMLKNQQDGRHARQRIYPKFAKIYSRLKCFVVKLYIIRVLSPMSPSSAPCLRPQPVSLSPPGVVSVAGRVYAVGGFNSSLRERTVDVYDGARDQWSAAASMQERRSTLGAAVLGELLYAVGGFNGSIGLSTVEVYSQKTNEWSAVASMNTRRSSVGVGVVDGKLYAVGGYDGASRQCLSTVEEYDPVSDQWGYVADMSTRRSGAGVGVLGGLLYAAGGHDGPLVRKSVEVFDPQSNTWRLVSDMNMCRRNAGVCAINGLLYVIGGDDGSCNLSSVEFYNPMTDKWSLIPTNMSNGRSYAGVAVIDKPL
ncbi:kelch-like protein 3 [Poecilia reticulata]|uniref:kelch-like protein 3 n=1 Tax=Poecilia reticulata TaxID=8081 RepID=UPI0007E93B59|nr:PREDICTED: kelch-like protein 3 [Poecilia reticulata]